MSLLLEALKKAEKAKEEAQRRANGAPAAAEPGRDAAPALSELRLQDDPPQAAEVKPVMTRAELPDISPSLEILSDDIASPKAAAAPAARRPPAREPDSAARRVSPQSSERTTEQASARKVFEAKFKEPNPRMPFYLTMGALGLAAFCTIGYFWYQLRPPAPLVNANPPVSGAVASVAATSAGAPLPAPAASPAAAPAAIPGLPSGAALPAAPATAAAPSAPANSTRTSSPTPAVPRASATTRAQRVARSTPAPVARAPSPAARVAEAEPTSPVVSRQTPQVLPQVQSGYTAFLAGDLLRARTDYEDALREEPANRDALLGLAAIDVRTGRYEAAEATYLNLLRADPRDAHAQAGLLSLRGARMDPLAAESRVKTLLAADPQAQVLHFTLGNQFAQQGRWGEAQQEYFKAFAAEPDNADFAYNLAVSLDHLRQPRQALDYYQRAITLAEKRGASFNLEAAKTRAAQLGK